MADWPDYNEEEFNRIKAELSNNNAKIDILDHPWIKELKSILHDDGDEPQTEDIDDEDIAMTHTEINTISKPVTNLACGHVYDKTSIEGILRQRSGVPFGGRCGGTSSSVQEEKATKRAIAKMKSY